MKRTTTRYIVLVFLISASSIIVALIKPLVGINENQILYLFSAASQVIAAIYGLTITGYIFFRNELDRKASEDESYDEIISYLKNDYYRSVIRISFFTIATIFLCFISISFETIDNNSLLTIAINTTVSTIIVELILIVAFVIEILNPKSFELASNEINKKLSLGLASVKGNLEEFLQNYNKIEQILEKYGNENVPISYSEIFSNKVKTVSKTKLVNILFKSEIIDSKLRDGLINIISFRNSLIHGTDLSVSNDSIEQVKSLLSQLQDALNAR